MSRMNATNLLKNSAWIVGVAALVIGSSTWAQGSRYQYVSDSVCWTQARDAAEAAGGHLATISSQQENNDVLSVKGSASAWIGFTDEASEGNFAWVTGESVEFTAWNSGEPNNLNNEDYTEMRSNGTWNDLPNCSTRGYVIEFDAQPVPVMGNLAIALLTGLLLLLAWRFRARTA